MNRPDPSGTGSALRNLPPVDALLQSAGAHGLSQRYGRAALTDALREALAELRGRMQAGELVGRGAGALIPRAGAPGRGGAGTPAWMARPCFGPNSGGATP